MTTRAAVKEIFYSALKAVSPYRSVSELAGKIREEYQNRPYKRLWLVGFGKAAVPMAKGLEDRLSDLISGGMVITKYGHNLPDYRLSEIKVREAGHPVPDERGVNATRELMDLLSRADDNTLVVCLISGGGSSLLVCPADGITLADKQEVTRLLLASGADIRRLNTVRKHLSAIKGGQLAEIAYPAKVISLILSDVVGDRLEVIASGPTSPDPTTFAEALQILDDFGLLSKVPQGALKLLERGVKGFVSETPKPETPAFKKVENLVIANNQKALEAARSKAEALGFKTRIISSQLAGEAREVGKELAQKAEDCRLGSEKICLISGGETTVKVRGNGLGGRNQELALGFAGEIQGMEGITLLSAGTDGIDGPTNAAGAVVDGQTLLKARELGLDLETYLAKNDSYHFLEKTGDLLITGPTGTNVMDLQIAVVE